MSCDVQDDSKRWITGYLGSRGRKVCAALLLVFHVDYRICVYGKHCFASPLFLLAVEQKMKAQLFIILKVLDRRSNRSMVSQVSAFDTDACPFIREITDTNYNIHKLTAMLSRP